MEYNLGRNKNRGNLKRAARRQGIKKPFQITLAELKTRLEVCKERNNYFRKHGARYRKKHLLQWAEAAREDGQDKAAVEILAIIKQEQDRDFWWKLNYTCGKTKGGSPTSIQVPRNGQDDQTDEYATQLTVHKAIWANIHCKRLYLAEEAPICQGQLQTDFGYNAGTRIATDILEGRYDYLDDFHQATKKLCEECALIQKIIPKTSVNIKMTKEDFRAHWKHAKEETSLPHSGLHFGHYIAGIESDYISHFHALKATLLLHHRLVLERWAQGLSAMLQKLFGCLLITQLQAILLMEADFNGTNKTVYAIRILKQTRSKNLMPEVVFSELNKMADNGTLTKVLTYDIIHQTQRSAGIVSVNADNCYDRIAHAIASLVFQAFSVSLSASESTLTTIQEMIFFLRTGFGDSMDFAAQAYQLKLKGSVKEMMPCQQARQWSVSALLVPTRRKVTGHTSHALSPSLKTILPGLYMLTTRTWSTSRQKKTRARRMHFSVCRKQSRIGGSCCWHQAGP